MKILRVTALNPSVTNGMSDPASSVVDMDQQHTMTPPLPTTLRHLADHPELKAAWDHQVAARRAEAAKITAMLAYRRRFVQDFRHDLATVRAEADKAAVRDAAVLLGASERTTTIVLNLATFAQETLPATWRAFQDGLIDLPRVRKIADAANAELDDKLIFKLDTEASEQAARRSLAEFQRWLTRFVADLDAETYHRICAKTRQDRYVYFEHFPDGMSLVEARIPTIEAVAIEKVLKAVARTNHRSHAHEVRETSAAEITSDQENRGPLTLAQREADLFSVWLRQSRAEHAGVDAKIMVMIPEATLTGDSNEPGMAADRSWRLPADQARALAITPGAAHQWYQGIARRIPEDADVDVLSVTYNGRFPPQRLRDSILFRDGTCQATGCTVPAERCDLDHRTPWDAGGTTSGQNLWALCRRHHRMKSHGHLPPPPRMRTSNHDDDDSGDPAKRRILNVQHAVDLTWPASTYSYTLAS